MACGARHQCRFFGAVHHLGCVSVAGGFCEYGEGCNVECSLSWPEGDTEKNEASEEAFQEYWKSGQFKAEAGIDEG